ncbi:flagellar motor protein MotB [Burkholderia aenigmatica]|uniref:Flagellar motor protein MotB n=1 Tax=Burkholderia aenigmatica TaxID=2015348 RepID=A0ABY6XWB5_9BURK|nr:MULTISPECIES: flagellar motor protein MotB [Burkholderia]UKD14142.1 flagellar motor protein MotB [Burkholderia aenigmatica]VWC93853.1 flagellar motor protein MotB [Burkholderia aenigmatica]VWD29992.1 flagellar motor protein MotB [Burkholderia aenigmatica]
MADSRSNPSKQAPLVVVRRRKGEDHDAHHGGAWKIAYADFVTAMMAFFLLMWLLGSVSKYDKQGIEDYFNTPLSTLLSGGKDAQAPRPSVVQGGGRDLSDPAPAIDSKAQPVPASAPAALAAIVDTQKLERLKAKLTAAIAQSPSLRAYQDQIRIAITHEGLRIEIVDSLKRPMFASGSAQPESYATAILAQIGTALDDVENRVSIAGHTDSTPYPDGPTGYSNWELSSDRANAARRALVAGGLREDKLLQVRGLADVLPLDKNVADEPTNRRISILVMNNAAEQAFFRDGGRTTMDETAGARAAVLPAAVTRQH